MCAVFRGWSCSATHAAIWRGCGRACGVSVFDLTGISEWELCDNPRMKLSLFSTLLALFAGNAFTADAADNLLPVEQAFKVEAKAVDRGTVQFDFKIADDYYLYRERVKVKSSDASVTLGALDLPA